MTLRHTLLAVCVVVSACAATPRDPGIPSDVDDPAAMPDERLLNERDERAEAPPKVAERRRTGTILRHELDAWLDGGPPRFLRGVPVHAAVIQEAGAPTRFQGWVVEAFWPGDARFATVDLQPGDIIRTVNGVALARPEHLQSVWDGLREATRLVVEVTRPPNHSDVSETFTLEYMIVDTP
jgi:hypothetical protein